jgi:hypothetical protein
MREIASRFPKRISQFLNFDENLRIQEIVICASGSLRGMSTTYPSDLTDAE